jgi:hypothetical protein
VDLPQLAGLVVDAAGEVAVVVVVVSVAADVGDGVGLRPVELVAATGQGVKSPKIKF